MCIACNTACTQGTLILKILHGKYPAPSSSYSKELLDVVKACLTLVSTHATHACVQCCVLTQVLVRTWHMHARAHKCPGGKPAIGFAALLLLLLPLLVLHHHRTHASGPTPRRCWL